MAFTVIAFAPGITTAERGRAQEGAPPFTAADASYPDLLEVGGWRIEARSDLTASFEDISRRELAAFELRTDRLIELLGESDFEGRIALRRARLDGIRDGAIRRELYVVRPVVDGRSSD